MSMRSDQSPGFSLVEVVLALGIASFALIALIGMLPIGMASNRDADRETQAVAVLSTLITDLKNSPTNQATSILGLDPHPLASTGATVLYFGENEKLTTDPNEALCKLQIRRNPSTNTGISFTAQASWPAQAPAGREAGLVETYVVVPQ